MGLPINLKIKYMKKLFLIISLFCATISFSFSNSEISQTTLREQLCTKENVYLAIQELGIEYPKIVYSQIMIESGNLTSKLAKTNNNLLGMKHPTKRATTSCGSKNGYAFYDSWYSCLEDYSLYQQMILDKRGKLSKQQYVNYLNKYYAEDPNYDSKIFKKLKSELQLLSKLDSNKIAYL